MNARHAQTNTGTFVVLSGDECWQLVNASVVGRLGFTASGDVLVLPVNYFVYDEQLWFRTSPGSVIADLASGRTNIAFEVDHHYDLYQSGWSVLMHGDTHGVSSQEAERAITSTRRLGPWPPGDRSVTIRFAPTTVSGRRVRR